MGYKREQGNKLDLARMTAEQIATLRSQVMPNTVILQVAEGVEAVSGDLTVPGDLAVSGTASASAGNFDGPVTATVVAVEGLVSAGSADISGEARVNALRIDAAPSVAVATASTHKIAINLNGTTYYMLLSNA